MNRFWAQILHPIARAAEARTVCEIGAQHGLLTEKVLAYCHEVGGIAHIVDPAPTFDVDEWRSRYGATFDFHLARSLDSLPGILPVDLVLIDGDHNWYTVFHELRLIERLSLDRSPQLPVLVLHDMGWPYARRDLYYDPSSIPEEHRHPHARRGLHPDSPELVEGGLNDHLENAQREGAARNGVRTAVDDFMAESQTPWELHTLPGLHGLGVLVEAGRLHASRELARVVKRLGSTELLGRQLDSVERERILAEIRVAEARVRYRSAEEQNEKLKSRAAEHSRARDEADVARAAAERLVEEHEHRRRDTEAARGAAEQRVTEYTHSLAEGHADTARLARELGEASAAKQILSDQLRELSDRLDRITSERDAACAEAEQHAIALARLEGERAQLLDRLARLTVDGATAREQRETAHAEATAELRARGESAESEREAAREHAGTLAVALARLEGERAQLVESLERIRMETKAAGQQRERRHAGEVAELRTRLARAEEHLEASRKEAAEHAGALARADRERAELGSRLERLSDDRDDAETELVRQRGELASASAMVERSLGRERTLRSRLAQERDELEEALARAEALDSALVEARASLADAHGALAELERRDGECVAYQAEALRESAARAALEDHVEALRAEIARSASDSTMPASEEPEAIARVAFLSRFEELRRTGGLEDLDDREMGSPWPVFAKARGGSKRPRISVIVCVHDALEDLRRCLVSVARHLTPDAEVIVVDDGSAEPTAGFLTRVEASTSRLRVVRNQDEPHGYTIAANLGLRAAHGEYVVLLNSDTEVTSGWLERIVACGESDPAIGIIGPVSNAATHQSVPSVRTGGEWATNPLPHWLPVDGMGAVVAALATRERPRVPFVNGFCYVVRRRVLESVGYLDEERFASGYCEENDLSVRARSAGFQGVIADDVFVFHAKSRSYTPEGRKRLAKRNYASFVEKHGKETIAALVGELEGQPPVAALGERLASAIADPRAFVDAIQEGKSDPLRPVFILPGLARRGSGGSHSVVQEVGGMRDLGVAARIAVPATVMARVEDAYPDRLDAFVPYDDEAALAELMADANAVVATHFRSVSLVKRLAELRRDLVPAYYVQDYEPFFAPPGSDSADQALATYTAIPGQLLFAKTHWLCTVVSAAHGVPVAKVSPSIDHEIYHAKGRGDGSSVLRIVAMVRPRTPRRQPLTTVRTLERLRRTLGADVETVTFGCEPHELAQLTDDQATMDGHAGVLTRVDVAELLRSADIFLDLSIYQAFGRTALEAMACGCVPVVPSAGGAWEYAQPGVNAIVTRTDDEAVCFADALRIARDDAARRAMSAAGRETAGRYTVERAALSELSVLAAARLHPARKRSRKLVRRG